MKQTGALGPASGTVLTPCKALCKQHDTAVQEECELTLCRVQAAGLAAEPASSPSQGGDNGPRAHRIPGMTPEARFLQ